MSAFKNAVPFVLVLTAMSCAVPARADAYQFSVQTEGKNGAAIESAMESAMEKLGSALAQAEGAAREVNIDVREIRETIRQSLEDASRNGSMIFRRSSGDDVEPGNPYSAREVREFKQKLGDGTVISRQSTRLLARDREGRTRQELRQPDGSARVFINDPVAKQAYILDPQKRVACKADFSKAAINDCFSQMKGEWKPLGFAFSVNRNGIAMMHAQDDLVVEVSPHAQIIDLTQRSLRRNPPDGAPPPLPPQPPQPPLSPLPPTFSSALNGPLRANSNASVTREKKTKQSYEGLLVDTDRTVETIAAGSIGNNKPIESVHERYYSPELKMTVYVRRSDPRNGEYVYRMADVKRSDPEAAAFRVPPGYTVTEGRK
jgi:hypothetical protein